MEQLTNLGPMIGKGNTAEVYRCDDNYIVKLYTESLGPHLAYFEHDILSALNRAGTPAPVIGNLVKYNDRIGIKMEFVPGTTLDKLLIAEDARRGANARLMATLHARIHATTTGELQTQYTAFYNTINNNRDLLGSVTDTILNYLDTLPAGSQVCHGDFHPKNIIAGSGKSMVIDWTNAYRGNPLGDLVLTRLRMLTPYISKGFSGDTALFIAAKKNIYDVYWQTYKNLTNVTETELDAWLLPCAAAQLHPSKPVHTQWLLQILRQQLNRQSLL
ncbi:phosphotransferase family protein [Mucilaginibacter sp. KACC 22063]|uniref:phosphotransferase family protein n=1 Tax=Mucilaginibacter sp. KACC 22063 TaxID=3025666 RepID=UPI0023663936|nr:aminoglycoside phosphotransferase family protein [Mucilaginibacter sp. KACC 22063]WDF57250.1 aminoglycoside phosphotransferase family protein [Mucilaginibacter sp. KACC 22063]